MLLHRLVNYYSGLQRDWAVSWHRGGGLRAAGGHESRPYDTLAAHRARKRR